MRGRPGTARRRAPAGSGSATDRRTQAGRRYPPRQSRAVRCRHDSAPPFVLCARSERCARIHAMLPRHHDPIVAVATAPGPRRGRHRARVRARALDGADRGRLRPRAARRARPPTCPFSPPTGRRSTRAWRCTSPRRTPTPAKTCSSCRRMAGRWCCSCCWRAAWRPRPRRRRRRTRLPGLRLAEPGEFTERAFLNGKLDLAQAEAVSDLIEASTEAAARSAGRSLSGAFSKQINALRDRLIELRMLVEATLDFPEEEIDFLEKADARGRLDARRRGARRGARARAQGALLREGIKVVLAGPAQRRQELAAERAGRRRAGDRHADPRHHARQGQRDDPDRRRAGARDRHRRPARPGASRPTRSSASASRAAGPRSPAPTPCSSCTT